MKHKKVTFFILLSTFYFLFSWQVVFASEVFFEQRGSVVDVFLNTQGQFINAFEGIVTFDKDAALVKEIIDGNSIVNFWIEKPKSDDGVIMFSGITPGGFSGNRGLLFSAVFETKKSGDTIIDLRDGVFLKNDDSGTQDLLMVAPFNFSIARAQSSSSEIKDTIMPEDFAPQIAKAPNIFSNKWFLAFSTQDKNSGVDYYEVKESSLDFLYFLHPWVVSDSPYVFKDQKLQGHVLVKAVDKAGNERVVSVNLPYHRGWYQNVIIWIIIIVAVAVFTLLACLILKYRKTWSKSHT